MLLRHENLIQVTPLQTVHRVVWNIAATNLTRSHPGRLPYGPDQPS